MGTMPDFWSPEFAYDRRPDGTVLMWQTGDLPAWLPTLADYLDRWADAAPDRVWIARRGADGAWREVTYGQARDRARAIGDALLGLGLGPDRPLLILSGNSLEHALLAVACACAGIPHAPLSPAYALVSKDHGKLKSIAATLNPGAVYAEDGAAFGAALAVLAAWRPQVIVTDNPPPGAVTFAALIAPAAAPQDAGRIDRARAAIGPDTVVKYLFTSGSTGSPKAVINTNRMICANQAMIRDCYRFVAAEPPVVLDWAPWNHTAGGNKVFYMVMTNGGTLYIDDGKPVAGKFEETVRNLRDVPCTWYFNVPLGWDMLVERLETDPALAATFFRRLRMMFYAGAGMAQHTWDRLRAVARATVGRDVLLSTSLGATETAPFALSCTTPQDRSGNVGVPARGLVTKLVPTGDKLELRLKGPSITPGYLGDPARTAEAFDDEGFYCMGDALRPADPDDLARGFFFDGRVAENFKLNTGTWVAVGAVRAALVDALGGLIRDAVITGENEGELGALILLSPRGQGLAAPALEAGLRAGLAAQAAAASGSSMRVRRLIVLDEEPSFDRGEVTEKGSLNQRAMRARHAALIAGLHAGTAAGMIRA
jgi:feruloyl-CoA synthase